MMVEMRFFWLILLLVAMPASAQIYRWVDEKGTVHYSNAKPPQGVKATVFDADAKAGPPSPESAECYTRALPGRAPRAAPRAARGARERGSRRSAPRRRRRAPRGLDFRQYVSLHRGMTEGELLGIAGAPDLLFSDVFASKNYTYLPTSGDPFTTTITVISGRINHIERVRKF